MLTVSVRSMLWTLLVCLLTSYCSCFRSLWLLLLFFRTTGTCMQVVVLTQSQAESTRIEIFQKTKGTEIAFIYIMSVYKQLAYVVLKSKQKREGRGWCEDHETELYFTFI